MRGKTRTRRSLRVVSALLLGVSALILSSGLNFLSERASFNLSPCLGIPFLLLVILLGVAADVIGIATARAREPALMSMASRKIKGSRESLWFVRNADVVSSVANDLLGDVSATVAGSLAMGLSFRLAGSTGINRPVLSALAVGVAAALAVGGKAFVKGIGLKRAESIVYYLGLISSAVRGAFPRAGMLGKNRGDGQPHGNRRSRNDPS